MVKRRAAALKGTDDSPSKDESVKEQPPVGKGAQSGEDASGATGSEDASVPLCMQPTTVQTLDCAKAGSWPMRMQGQNV